MTSHHLLQLVQDGNLSAVRDILASHPADAGSVVNRSDPSGRTPLMAAVESPDANVDMVRMLLEYGAALEARDAWKCTPWLIAVETGDLAKARYLREAGADTSARGSSGKSALFYAIENDHTPMLQWLIEIGADIEATDDFENTCLMHAADYDNPEAVKILLRAGVDVTKKDSLKKVWEFAAASEDTMLREAAAAMRRAGTEAYGKSALQSTESPEVARLLLNAGADPQDLTFEARRALLGLEPEPDVRLLRCSAAEFREGRAPRFGAVNPEPLHSPFCESMIRAGVNGYLARDRFEAEVYAARSPVWSAQRFGQSITFLPDGRIVQIAGEHEDSYDPDFNIYNDVFVHHPDGSIQIFNYPEYAFPPTDFHTATLIGESIYIIGSLGYHGKRHYDTTSVYRLDTKTFRIVTIRTTGSAPGWIYKHRADLQSPGEIRVSGGEIATKVGGEEIHTQNAQVYILDIQKLRWSMMAK